MKKITQTLEQISEENKVVSPVEGFTGTAKDEMVDSLWKSNESKESIKKLELESENYKIPSWKTLEEKNQMWWFEEEKVISYINGNPAKKFKFPDDGQEKDIRRSFQDDDIMLSFDSDLSKKSECLEEKPPILRKEINSHGAAVIEYQDDGNIPKHLVGEQLFNVEAIAALGLELPTYDQLEEIKREYKNHELFLKNNFQKNGQIIFPGKYVSRSIMIDEEIGFWLYLWLAEWESAMIGRDENAMGMGRTNPDCFYSVRLLKK